MTNQTKLYPACKFFYCNIAITTIIAANNKTIGPIIFIGNVAALY